MNSTNLSARFKKSSKTLVALAALAATSAFAQNVTLYGLIDVAYGAKKFETPAGIAKANQSGVMDGGYAGNRIGFRGTEDIGGGKTAGFLIEEGISPTNASMFGVRAATAGLQYDGYAASTGRFDQGTTGGYSQGNNRQAFASLADKSLGEIRAGYQYTAVYEMSTLMGFTTMSEGVVGGSSSHTHGQAVAGGTRANGIQYISPRFNGFGAAVQVGSGTGRDTTEFDAQGTNTAAGVVQAKAKRTSWKADYEQGPWKAAYAATSMVSATAPVAGGNTTFNVYGALTSASAAAALETDYNTSLNQIAGSYTGSNWKVGYQRNSGKLNVTAGKTDSAANRSTYTVAGAYDIKSQRVSGMYSIGALDLIAGQGTATVDDFAGLRQMDLKESQIGALYNLSKRTRVYYYQGQWTDNAQATGQGGASYAKGKQNILGMAHSF